MKLGQRRMVRISVSGFRRMFASGSLGCHSTFHFGSDKDGLAVPVGARSAAVVTAADARYLGAIGDFVLVRMQTRHAIAQATGMSHQFVDW